ncbi:MAG TPA: hypothetical protein VMF64_11770 [Steroidobacteraceae bacterium]|nr:hypothetical protein [Steroidobacteraceae bacterium]
MKQEDHNHDGRQYHDSQRRCSANKQRRTADETRNREQRIHKVARCKCVLEGNRAGRYLAAGGVPS